MDFIGSTKSSRQMVALCNAEAQLLQYIFLFVQQLKILNFETDGRVPAMHMTQA